MLNAPNRYLFIRFYFFSQFRLHFSWKPSLPDHNCSRYSSFASAIEVVQRYQLNHSHDGAEHNEARAEDSLAIR